MTRGGLRISTRGSRAVRGEESVGGNPNARADHAADDIRLWRNAIEGGGRAEIHDHARAAKFFKCRHCIDDAIRTHLCRIVILHRHASLYSGLNKERLDLK